MWNNNNNSKAEVVKGEDEEDDSWEIRAFEEDITAGNQLGCTWPPRSYTCNFCRREFRSAQALGGHMNVHRRDRARLHQHQHQHHPILPPSSSSCNIISNGFPKSSTINLVPAAQEFLPNGLCIFYPNGVFAPSSTPPHLISLSNRPANSNNTQTSAASNISSDDVMDADDKDSEVDLELRLGRGLSKDKSPVLD